MDFRPLATVLCLLATLTAAMTPRLAVADPSDPPLRRENWVIKIHLEPDLTYTETIEQEFTFLTPAGIPLADRDFVTFYPASQTLDLLEASVLQPDGSRIEAPQSARFTRPSAAAEDTPGFVGSETTTVLFPQLQAGSRSSVKWRLVQTKPSVLGFNLALRPLLEWPTAHMAVEIDAPAGLELHWRQQGAFTVSDEIAGGRRLIRASLDDVQGEAPERNAVASSDFQPSFLITSQPSVEALGAIYHRQAEDRARVTPSIAALAARIAGDRTGLDAARAIHDWIATNIRYVAVYLDPNDGWVPHAADEVLASGYGDCKDHVVLLQALLAARGIRAEAALVNWGTRYVSPGLGLPQQFNHVIAYLPDFDLYANPTNPYARLGGLDRRLSDKTVVLATEAGQVARTPPSRAEDNRYRADVDLAIEPDGTIRGRSQYDMTANIETVARADVAEAASTRDLAERMLSATPEGGFGDLQASDPKDLAHPFNLAASWSSPHGITLQNGDAYFATPVGVDFEQPGSLLRPYLATGRQRRHAVLASAMDLGWTYTVHLPQGYSLAHLPQDVHFRNETGHYDAFYERVGSDLRIRRSLVVDHDVYPAADFAALQHLFFTAIDDVRSVFVMARMEATR